MADVRHLEFSKFRVYEHLFFNIFMSRELYRHAILLPCANFTEIGRSAAELWPKTIFKMAIRNHEF